MGNHIYKLKSHERGTVRGKCLAKEHNTMFLARADKPGPLNPTVSAVTMKVLHLHEIM